MNAPVFVPKTSIISPPTSNPAPTESDLEPAALESPFALQYNESNTDISGEPSGTSLEHEPSIGQPYFTEDLQAQIYTQGGYADVHEYYPAHPSTFTHQPLNYHLYTQLPYVPNGAQSSRPVSHRFFMSDTVREDLQHRSEAIYSLAPSRQIAASMMNDKPLPEEIHTYHSFVPLEPSGPVQPTAIFSGIGASGLLSSGPGHVDPSGQFIPAGHFGHHGIQAHHQQQLHQHQSQHPRRKWFLGFPSIVYKATNRENGSAVALRRIEGFRLQQELAFSVVETWGKIKHPNIVHLREAFTTRAFGDHSLVFAYDYYPTAKTLAALHLQPEGSSGTPPPLRSHRHHRHGRGGSGNARDQPPQVGGPIEEAVLWSYIVQIANAMKEVHDRGLAIRTLDVSKVLVTGKNRVRVNCCGIFDVMTYDPRHASVEALRQDDLLAFGKLVLTLCCHNLQAVNNLPKSIEMLSRNYSTDLKNVVLFMISKPSPNKVIDQLLEMFGTRLLTEMNAMQNYADELEDELMSELENGRLVRLMIKLGFINERPDFNHELRWSETGDRYIISLFRDYVFHQVDETHNPLVNLTHVITCLNKLDAGTDERIMLVSRDEQTCLVVSYKEIKQCVDSAFNELGRAGLHR